MLFSTAQFFKKYEELSKQRMAESSVLSADRPADIRPVNPSTKASSAPTTDRSSTAGSSAQPQEQSSKPKRGKPPAKAADEPAVSSSDSYNGSRTDRYTWSQSLTDVDMRIPLPPGTKASQLIVDIQSSSLTVQLRKDKGTEPEV